MNGIGITHTEISVGEERQTNPTRREQIVDIVKMRYENRFDKKAPITPITSQNKNQVNGKYSHIRSNTHRTKYPVMMDTNKAQDILHVLSLSWACGDRK